MSVTMAPHTRFLTVPYRVIETKFGDKKSNVVTHWIDSVFDSVGATNLPTFKQYELDRQSAGLSHGKYIYDRCRLATAHASVKAPSDPDGTSEARRLSHAASVIRRIARYFIKHELRFSDSYLSDDATLRT